VIFIKLRPYFFFYFLVKLNPEKPKMMKKKDTEKNNLYYISKKKSLKWRGKNLQGTFMKPSAQIAISRSSLVFGRDLLRAAARI
jgi:hypothetical protein